MYKANFSKTDFAKYWMQDIGWRAKAAVRKQGWTYIDDARKIVMWLYVCWGDNIRRDMSNMHKILPDALQGIVYKDDRYLLVRDLDFNTSRSEPPRLEIVIYLLEDEVA